MVLKVNTDISAKKAGDWLAIEAWKTRSWQANLSSIVKYRKSLGDGGTGWKSH